MKAERRIQRPLSEEHDILHRRLGKEYNALLDAHRTWEKCKGIKNACAVLERVGSLRQANDKLAAWTKKNMDRHLKQVGRMKAQMIIIDDPEAEGENGA